MIWAIAWTTHLTLYLVSSLVQDRIRLEPGPLEANVAVTAKVLSVVLGRVTRRTVDMNKKYSDLLRDFPVDSVRKGVSIPFPQQDVHLFQEKV